jgi:hypothetical protein
MVPALDRLTCAVHVVFSKDGNVCLGGCRCCTLRFNQLHSKLYAVTWEVRVDVCLCGVFVGEVHEHAFPLAVTALHLAHAASCLLCMQVCGGLG